MSIIKPLQIRAARALVNWSREDLAKRSGISVTTIHNIENEYHSMNSATLSKLMETFERANVAFIGQTGVELSSEIIKMHHGNAGFYDFFEDVYDTVKDNQKHILRISGVDETNFFQNLGSDWITKHSKRMEPLTNVEVRVLTSQAHDKFRLGYAQYRNVDEKYFGSVPSYNYGNKFAHIIWEPLQVIVINHAELAQANAKQFDFIWDRIK